jgi:BED zinc finger
LAVSYGGTASGGGTSSSPGDSSPGGALRGTESRVWEHYARLPANNGIRAAKCRYCGKSYMGNNASTGCMWRHIREVHPTRIATPGPAAGQVLGYTPSVSRERLVRWIVPSAQLFNKVEIRELRDCLSSLNPAASVP